LTSTWLSVFIVMGVNHPRCILCIHAHCSTAPTPHVLFGSAAGHPIQTVCIGCGAYSWQSMRAWWVCKLCMQLLTCMLTVWSKSAREAFGDFHYTSKSTCPTHWGAECSVASRLLVLNCSLCPASISTQPGAPGATALLRHRAEAGDVWLGLESQV
jgi:hypothetical protein